VLEDANRSWFLADDRSDLLDVEPANNTKEDDLGLLGRQRGDTGESFLAVAHSERTLLRIVGFVRFSLALDQEDRASSPLTATRVDQSSVRDREEPASERRVITVEAAKAGRRLQPDLGGKILSFGTRLGPQVAKKTRLMLPVESRDRPLGPRLRGGKNARKRLLRLHDRRAYPESWPVARLRGGSERAASSALGRDASTLSPV